MADVIEVIHRMVDDGVLAETRNASGRVETRFPRLALKMDEPPQPTAPEPPAPVTVPTPPPTPKGVAVGEPPPLPAEVKYHHTGPDGARVIASPAQIAYSVNANPVGRHLVWKEGMAAWSDPRTVPEIAAFLGVQPPPLPPDN